MYPYITTAKNKLVSVTPALLVHVTQANNSL